MTKVFDRFLKNPEEASCGCEGGCCGPPAAKPEGGQTEARPAPLTPADHAWIIGSVETAEGDVPLVATRLNRADRNGTLLARLSIKRMSHAVRPGLYGFGKPDAWSPVFVTGNYKMSFDYLRRSLDGRDGWILVLDTRGINVWCAAGKGTFGTDELVARMEAAGLARVVSHRTLILPQLGAPGVAAHEVAKRTKFRVVYGPIRAEDLPAFLDAGSKATPRMRRARFLFKDRIILTPVEIAMVIKSKTFLGILIAWALGLIGVKFLSFNLPVVLGAVFIGTVVVPALLPWIPVRAFSLKGWLLGFLWTAGFLALNGLPATAGGWLSAASYLLILPAFAAFIAMNFTGSSPITSLSGVVKEMKTAVPLMILSAGLGLGAFIAAAVVA
ncbi:MAG: mercury methylation corrinoid protein HgcA [Acidobacteriota bacterium]|nr:mercury methylation corrinoid protein HgcA [Acidobacteriota bacterium]